MRSNAGTYISITYTSTATSRDCLLFCGTDLLTIYACVLLLLLLFTQYYSKEDYLTGKYLFFEYDPKVYMAEHKPAQLWNTSFYKYSLHT